MLTRTILFLLITILVACDKNAPKRNEPFFCQVNGVAFRPEKSTRPIGGVGGDPLRTFWYPDKKEFSIAANSGNEFVGIGFKYLSSTILEGEYIIDSEGKSGIGQYEIDDNTANPLIVKGIDGKITITSNKDKKISGTFEFNGIAKSGKSYKITKGCFNNIEY